SGWIGFGAPRGTPPEIIATLNKHTNAAVLDPTIQQRFADLGAAPVPPNSPDEFAKFIAQNIHKWARGIRFSAIKPQRTGARFLLARDLYCSLFGANSTVSGVRWGQIRTGTCRHAGADTRALRYRPNRSLSSAKPHSARLDHTAPLK